MERARINGTELAYEAKGTGEPIVFIQGGIIADAFTPLMDEPALSGFKLVNYHRRGNGLSARPDGPVSVEEQAQDCHDLMRHLGIERAHIVGYSYGGMVALQLVHDFPVSVHSLALFEPFLVAAITDPDAVQYLMGTIGQAMGQYMAGNKTGAIEAMSTGAFGPGYRELLDDALPGAIAGAIRDADTLFSIEAPTFQQWSFTRNDAARIVQPVLSLYHDDPRWAGFRQTHDLLLEWLPQTETAVLSVSSHLLQMIAPREAAQRLAAFISRHQMQATIR
jgi:pimeloyl-ACP methyl ester carboxylesterase